MTNTKQHSYLELLVCFAVTAAVFWLYSNFTKGPIIHGDESGYLMNAAAFAGYRTDAFSSYYPGYSLPISLAFLGGVSPGDAYDRVQAINALLWAGAACIAYSLVTRLRPQMPVPQRILATLATVLYPAYPVFASLALSENLFVPLVLVLGLTLFLQARGDSWALAALAGVVVAFLAVTHPKGALVGCAATLAMLANVRGRAPKVLPRLLLMLVVAAACYLFMRTEMDGFLRDRLNARDMGFAVHYPGLEKILGDVREILTLDGFASFVSVMCGQLLYLVIGSFGLVVVGVVWCGMVIRDGQADRGERALAVLSLMSFLAVYAFSTFFMKDGIRADHVMYGRYTESVIAPLLLLGALSLPAKPQLKWAVVVTAVLAVVFLLLKGNPIDGSYVAMNVTTMDAARRMFPGTLNLVGLAIVGAIAIMLVRSPSNAKTGLALIVVGFIANAVMFAKNYLEPGSVFREKQHSLVDRIKQDFPDVKCVNYDMDRISDWEHSNYQFHLLPIRIDSVDRNSLFECGEFLISNATDASMVAPDAVQIGTEFASDQRLWIKRSGLAAWLKKQKPLEIPAGGVMAADLDKAAPKGFYLGWYGVESWGVWSLPSAHLMLAAPPEGAAALQLDFNLLATAAVPRSVELSCNGSILTTQRYEAGGDQSLLVDAGALARNGCIGSSGFVLDIEVSPTASPSSLGMSVDGRAMGIGLKRLAWTR